MAVPGTRARMVARAGGRNALEASTPRWAASVSELLRRHWLAAILLSVGLIMRVLTQITYHPALIYVDSLKYLYGAYPGSEPLGYAAILRLALPLGGLWVMTAIQHLLGLAMAVALYAVLVRRGVARWLAAIAVAPVLLDAYQLQIEQMILADTLFEALVVAGLVVLLWRLPLGVPGCRSPRNAQLSTAVAVMAGLTLGLSADVKQLGLALVLPALLYCLAAGGRRRQVLTSSAALAIAFALPVIGYCTYSLATTGHFRLANRQTLSGRLAAAADCATLTLPAAVRPLCPSPADQAHGPDWLEHSSQSPLYRTAVKPGTRGNLISELASAIARQQPLRVAAAIAHDWLPLFAATREPAESVAPLSRWQFQVTYPTFPPWVRLSPSHEIIVGLQRHGFGLFSYSTLKPSLGGKAQVDRPIAEILRSYQLDGGYTPGPLFALCALAGIAGSTLLLRRNVGYASRQFALATLLFTATATILLLVPDIYEFSWRYQLPAIVTLPSAGVLGVTALLAAARQHALTGRQNKESGKRQAGQRG